jgi:predicted transcriptional regulator
VRTLGELEGAIMRAVWHRSEPVTVREIQEAVNQQRDLAYTTVITVTERLRDKGLLARVRRGRSYVYEALLTADEYSAQLMTKVLDAADDRSGALLRFADQLDPGEAAALRAALARPPSDATAEPR